MHHARLVLWGGVQDIKEKNVSGVSFDLLFGHVRDGKHADVLQQVFLCFRLILR